VRALARIVALSVAAVTFVAGHPARADEAPDDVTVDVTVDKQTSKESAAAPDKLPARGKIKECCGVPVAGKDGYKLTFYWLAYEADYANEKYDTEIYTPQGFFLGRYPSTFVWEMQLEGTGVTMDGRVLNYAGSCPFGMGTCFKMLDNKQPLGAGVQGRALEPFRSIAVDPKRIPIGAPVWVPELAGLPLPDGTRHDGCLRADDQGGAIKMGRIDYFVESYQAYKAMRDAMWWGDRVTPHVEEPRCEYLRLHLDREHQNERVDWAQIHQKSVVRADRVALAKMMRNRAIAKRWALRHAGGNNGRVAVAQVTKGTQARGVVRGGVRQR
jgi:3D (Asp-Asp-Asp) domain-containing protein